MKNKQKLNDYVESMKGHNFGREDYGKLYSGYETRLTKKGYLQFRVAANSQWMNVHTVVNLYYNKYEHDIRYKELVESGIERYLITHHAGYWLSNNKLNNHPNNLQWLGYEEHTDFHSIGANAMQEFNKKVWDKYNPEYNNFEEYREKIIQQSIDYNDKMWNPENPEYEQNKEEREKLRKLASENGIKNMEEFWYGEGNEERRIQMSQVSFGVMTNLWNDEKFRVKMAPILVDNGRKFFDWFWNSEENKEGREKQAKDASEQAKKLWHGENNEEFREKISNGIHEAWFGEGNEELREKMKPVWEENGRNTWNKIWNSEGNEERRAAQSEKIKAISYNTWHGPNNEEFREQHAERLRKRNLDKEFIKKITKILTTRNTDIKHKTKAKQNKVFKTFIKIERLNQKITYNTYEIYKYYSAPSIQKVFEDIENALKIYANFTPNKRMLKTINGEIDELLSSETAFISIDEIMTFSVIYKILENHPMVTIKLFNEYKTKNIKFLHESFESLEIAMEKYNKYISFNDNNQKIKTLSIKEVKKYIDSSVKGRKILEGRIFGVFFNIVENKELITHENYLKHRGRAPHISIVFNSMKEAINKFEIFKSNEKQLKSFHHRKKYVKQNPKPKIYKDPAETIIKNKQSRIFGIFNKIIEANEFITYETFLKFKGRNIPHIKTVFESIEDAIEKYQIFPKRYIPKTNIIN
jgi:hypothetical protein